MESVRPGWCSPWAELQHDDLVAIGDLAGVLEDLVGENHEVLAGLVMVILVDQEDSVPQDRATQWKVCSLLVMP